MSPFPETIRASTNNEAGYTELGTFVSSSDNRIVMFHYQLIMLHIRYRVYMCITTRCQNWSLHSIECLLEKKIPVSSAENLTHLSCNHTDTSVSSVAGSRVVAMEEKSRRLHGSNCKGDKPWWLRGRITAHLSPGSDKTMCQALNSPLLRDE